MPEHQSLCEFRELLDAADFVTHLAGSQDDSFEVAVVRLRHAADAARPYLLPGGQTVIVDVPLSFEEKRFLIAQVPNFGKTEGEVIAHYLSGSPAWTNAVERTPDEEKSYG